ncbi:ribosome biogenesis protein SLX9-domain-containing protein [Exophiala viscosa]|uniref:Ribosome biogenesis protein SLX9 n=1 Tax=Exophiala viscosa TaxID=2486360 RepID=A0AAN6DZF0_9EURO|nr:ribosome biogenesis protein SLX9-domain-containing protein [Exophiala viscosa]
MAPPTRTANPPKSILKRSSTSATPQESLFPSSKKDKRRVKHEQLLNKVTKSSSKKPRRRRPDKKLVATLDSLADALPTGDGDDDTTAPGAAGERAQDQVNIIKRNSMKSKPGALKRREKLDKGERDRFAKNMAQLAAPRPAGGADKENEGDAKGVGTAVPSTTERWAALRGFISQTLETKPELRSTKT